MEKMFGTDGVRGKAGEGYLTKENVVRFGKILGHILKKFPTKLKNRGVRTESGRIRNSVSNVIGKGKILIGRDTRASGPEIEDALIEGVSSFGIESLSGGILPTPAVSLLTRKWGCALGISISASHNPAQDNGIKLISSDGTKIPDDAEEMIERFFHDHDFNPRLKRTGGERSLSADESARAKEYLECVEFPGLSLKGFTIVVDCANGALSGFAPAYLSSLGADVVAINDRPDGWNINAGCGATDPRPLVEEVLRRRTNVGVAFDGDGDRAIFVDETGSVRDGDHVLALCATAMKASGALRGDAVISTIMANFGLEKYLREIGVGLIRAPVGDRYVLEEMIRNKSNLGGEQSGHIIFLDKSPTGDGLITAQHVFRVMAESRLPLSQLAQAMKKFPQTLVNIRVKGKIPFDQIPEIVAAHEDARRLLGNEGRIVLRYSGTENVARLMVEGQSDTIVQKAVGGVEESLRKTIGA